MIDLAQIISEVQMDINDEAGERVQRAEYVDLLNTVMRKIAERTQIYIARYISIPNPSSSPVSPEPLKANIPFNDGVNNLYPYKFLRVIRGSNDSYRESREYSVQAVGATSAGHASFPINAMQLDNRAFSTQFYNDADSTVGAVDGSLTINFPVAFELDEQVIFDFIQSVPFRLTNWTTPINFSIPVWMEDVVKYGLLLKVQERLYNKGDETLGHRLERNNAIYQKVLRECETYTKNIRDEYSTYQSFPRLILPE